MPSCNGKTDEPLILSGPKMLQELTATSLSDTKNSIRVREFPNSHIDSSVCLAPLIDEMPTDFSTESFAILSHKIHVQELNLAMCEWMAHTQTLDRTCESLDQLT